MCFKTCPPSDFFGDAFPWQHFHRVIPGFMNQFGTCSMPWCLLFSSRNTNGIASSGCPYAKDPNSPRAGTGGPNANTKFTSCDNKSYTRNSEGGIPDEIGQQQHRITNGVGTLSMANTGESKKSDS